MKMEEIPYDKLPLGFRFRPTDEQLINHYLKRKIDGTIQPSESWVIPEIDVCRTEPWDLPSKWRVKSSDLEWFFFAAVDRKYPSGNRSNRATENGYWKATGKDRLIKSKKVLVGMKKTLVFHIGRAPRGTGSCWIMHEYRVVNPDGTDVVGDEGAFVLCRLFKKDKDTLNITPLSQTSPKSDLSDDPHKINPENSFGQITEYNVANDEVLPNLVPTTIKPEQNHSNSDITTDVGTHQELTIKQEEDSLFDGLKDFLGSEYDQILSPEAPENYTINPKMFEQQLCVLSTSDMAGTNSRDSDDLKPMWRLHGKPVHKGASKRSQRVPSEMHEPIERATHFTSDDGSLKASSSYETEINIRHRMPESSNSSMNYPSPQGTAERRIKLESVRHRKPKKQVEIEPPMATSVVSDQSSFSSNSDGDIDTNDLKVESPTSGYSVPMHKIAVAVLVIMMMLCAGTMWLLTS